MKSLIRTFVIVAAVAAPAWSQAQESTPAPQPQQSNATASGYGGTAGGNDQAGSQQKHSSMFHRNGASKSGDNCVGPISYCSIFFGS
jgi:hypothetical protein